MVLWVFLSFESMNFPGVSILVGDQNFASICYLSYAILQELIIIFLVIINVYIAMVCVGKIAIIVRKVLLELSGSVEYCRLMPFEWCCAP